MSKNRFVLQTEINLLFCIFKPELSRVRRQWESARNTELMQSLPQMRCINHIDSLRIGDCWIAGSQMRSPYSTPFAIRIMTINWRDVCSQSVLSFRSDAVVCTKWMPRMIQMERNLKTQSIARHWQWCLMISLLWLLRSLFFFSSKMRIATQTKRQKKKTRF